MAVLSTEMRHKHRQRTLGHLYRLGDQIYTIISLTDQWLATAMLQAFSQSEGNQELTSTEQFTASLDQDMLIYHIFTVVTVFAYSSSLSFQFPSFSSSHSVPNSAHSTSPLQLVTLQDLEKKQLLVPVAKGQVLSMFANTG